MKTSGPLWCGGGPTRHSSASAGEAAMATVVASVAGRLIGPRSRDALCLMEITSPARAPLDGGAPKCVGFRLHAREPHQLQDRAAEQPVGIRHRLGNLEGIVALAHHQG